MKLKFYFLIPLVIVLGGCATGYQSKGFWGDGYTEIITAPDSYVVMFKGNQYTSSDKVLEYVLLRASELTLKNGYNYFIIISSADQTSSSNYSNTYANIYGNTSGSASTYSGTIVKPGSAIRIKCFKDRPQCEEAIDAKFYWETNSKG